MGVLEEIEMRGCNERNRDVYYLMAQIEILRGNIMIGYKLFMEALNHLKPGEDDVRIEYINSFIMPYKASIQKAIEFEKMLEGDTKMTDKVLRKSMQDLKLIDTIDRKYSDLIKLKLHSHAIDDPFDLITMVEQVYNRRSNDIKLALYFFDLVFKHKDLVKMVTLRDQILSFVES